MAKAFANQGANLVLLARRMNLLEENARIIHEEFGVEVLPFACDITDTERVKEAVKATMDKFGRVDILMNNAGTGAVANAEDITDEQFKKELDIDLFGTFVCSREFGKEMIKAKYGRIINIASMYGLVGNMIVGSAPYHAAKGGVVNLTRALAAEWGKHGITVNSICPGYFYTDLTTETLDSDFFQAIAKRSIPIERYGKSGELDTCALFLASPASTYVDKIGNSHLYHHGNGNGKHLFIKCLISDISIQLHAKFSPSLIPSKLIGKISPGICRVTVFIKHRKTHVGGILTDIKLRHG